MSYHVSWYIPNKVLMLRLEGDYKLEDAKAADTQIVEILNNNPGGVMMLIDASRMSRPYNYQQIRSAQTFINHPKLRHAAILTHDRLVKLSLLVIFGWGRCGMTMFDSLNDASSYFDRLLGR